MADAAQARRFCERCKAEIPAARLEAMPETRVCIECSRAIGGEFRVVVRPENTGKKESLKKNYGSWSAERVRKGTRPAD